MQNFLVLPKQDRKLIIEQTAARTGWVASSVEKDFWVCWTLAQLFAMQELVGHLTFKGGTSLSKAWGLIDRFSEDIDLTISRDVLGFGGENSPEHGHSSKQQVKRLKALRLACGKFVSDIVCKKLNEKFVGDLAVDDWTLAMDVDDPDGQTLIFRYPTHFGPAHTRYLRPSVKIEFGARSDPWPAEKRPIRPVMAEAFPQVFLAPAVLVHTLAPERTFWEKAMLLHEETFRPNGKARRPRMARHYYDVYRLIVSGIAAKAATDMNLFNQVLKHRQVFFSHTWVDYHTISPGTLRLSPMRDQEAAWRRDYSAMQTEMFTKTPPTFDAILATVKTFEDAFNA